jgi:hypothetical protein
VTPRVVEIEDWSRAGDGSDLHAKIDQDGDGLADDGFTVSDTDSGSASDSGSFDDSGSSGSSCTQDSYAGSTTVDSGSSGDTGSSDV